MVSGIGGMAALSGGIGGIVVALWRHGGIGGMAGGIGGIVAALLAAWRHCWRHCGGIGSIGGIVAALAALLPFSFPVLHLSLCCPSGLVTRDARYAAGLGAVRMPKARYGRLL